MKKKSNRILTRLLAACVSVSMVVTVAAAAVWDLNNGSVTVTAAKGKAQQVSQTGGGKTTTAEDSAPVVTSKGQMTTNNVTINATGGATAKVTLKDTGIKSGNESAVDAGGVSKGSKAEITVEGKNMMKSNGSNAAVHVSKGDVVIQGSPNGGKGSVLLGVSESGAGIGSNAGEDMSGGITVKDQVVLCGGSSSGAGIGSGAQGSMSGDISLEGGTRTEARSKTGAGIGSGANEEDAPEYLSVNPDAGGQGAAPEAGNGKMSGTITFKDEAQAAAESREGAGIGSGKASEMSGTITAQNSTEVNTVSGNGAGIGSGVNADMSGSFTARDQAKTSGESGNGAGIGSGACRMAGPGPQCLTPDGGSNEKTAMSGSLNFQDQSQTSGTSIESGAGIGSGVNSDLTGSVKISGNAVVEGLGGTYGGAGIGSGTMGDMSGSISQTDSSLAGGVSDLGAGIGSGAGGEMSGSIGITSGGGTAAGSMEAAGIGAGSDGSFTGQIYLGSQSQINALDQLLDNSGRIGNARPDVLADKQVLKDGQRGSITIEQGAHVGKNQEGIQSLEDVKNRPEDFYDYLTVEGEPVNVYILGEEGGDTRPAPEAVIYWVMSDGTTVYHQDVRDDGVLTVTADFMDASFNCTVSGLRTLMSQGIRTVIFRTVSCQSSFDLATAAEGRSGTDLLKLEHLGEQAEMTVGGQAAPELLK